MDSEGRTWDVVLGRASWGAHAAIFVPVGHEQPVRQADLSASTMVEAMDAIDGVDEAALHRLLETAKIKEE